MDKVAQPDSTDNGEDEKKASLWTPEDGDEEDEESAPAAGAPGAATPVAGKAEGQEWFMDDM